MARFRKRPPEVEAIQWTGENGKEILKFAEEKNAGGHVKIGRDNELFAIYPYGLVDVLDYIVWDEDSQTIEVWSKRQFENKYEPMPLEVTMVSCPMCTNGYLVDHTNGGVVKCDHCHGVGFCNRDR